MKIKPLIIGVVVAGTLAACGGGDNPSATGTSSQNAASPTPSVPPTWSLTGLPSEPGDNAKPILVVKVENDPTVRPQTGLDHADLIFEELVEGGITRFATVFQSDIPAEIGPVRSIRHVDASLASPMADIFVFSGGAPKTMRFVEQKVPASITVVTEGGVGMYRSRKHSAPHNVFLKPAKLIASVADNASPSDGFFVRLDPNAPLTAPTTSPSAVPSGSATPKPPTVTITPTSKVSVGFSTFENPVWKWNAEKGLWMRFERSTPFKNIDGTQFGTKNLVLLYVKTIDAGYNDPAGNYVPRSVLTHTGPGYLITDGKRQKVTWSKEHVADPVTLFDEAGNQVAVPTGKTWVSLVPVKDGKVKFTGVKPSASPTATP